MYMKNITLRFQFDHDSEAKLAIDSLQELDYQPSSYSIKQNTVHLEVDLDSSTPSLEIMLAHGGALLEDEHSLRADETFSQAYQLETYLESDNSVSEHEVDVDISHDHKDTWDKVYHVDHDTTDAIDVVPPSLTEHALIDPYVALGYYEFALLEEKGKKNV
jgi:hypothetical protein